MPDKSEAEKNVSVLKRTVENPFFAIAVTISVLLVALLLDRVKDSVSWENLLIAAGVVFFITFVNMLVGALVNKAENQENFDSQIERINTLILSNSMNWLVNERYVEMAEAQADEIWAFAPELTFAIEEDTPIFKAVQRNLARGSKYKIFMPNRPTVHRIVAEYNRLHEYADGQVEFILIPHEEFIFHTIISVYDPISDEPRAIEWLPNDEMVAWLEMDSKHARRMVGVGEIMLERYEEQEDGSAPPPKARGKKVIRRKDG